MDYANAKIPNSDFYSQFRHPLHSPGRGGSGILGSLVHHSTDCRGTLSEDWADWKSAGAEQALAGPVVVEAAVDGAEVVGEVDVDSSGNHGDEGEKEGV